MMASKKGKRSRKNSGVAVYFSRNLEKKYYLENKKSHELKVWLFLF
ncbi:hypothetical protein FUSO3_08720 [Fusobacterium necrophorum BL]|uniref:Uncharacterized protein n=1 Tax=Fusobacterium necrophorum BL TaxID=1441732 RepID=A0AB73BW01_9FUSO|nr:hypothetical protein FUSO3_08720 [Fusobacterium necrophorum BL]